MTQNVLMSIYFKLFPLGDGQVTITIRRLRIFIEEVDIKGNIAHGKL